MSTVEIIEISWNQVMVSKPITPDGKLDLFTDSSFQCIQVLWGLLALLSRKSRR
jgi:hypothetical protein